MHKISKPMLVAMVLALLFAFSAGSLIAIADSARRHSPASHAQHGTVAVAID